MAPRALTEVRNAATVQLRARVAPLTLCAWGRAAVKRHRRRVAPSRSAPASVQPPPLPALPPTPPPLPPSPPLLPVGAATDASNNLSNAETVEVLRKKLKCSICLDSIDELTTTSCGHLFCWSCVREWVRRNKTCPLCKRKQTLRDVHRIFV